MEEFPQHLMYRLSIPDFYKKINYIPNIIYYQNLACEHDYERHFHPFINELFELTKQEPFIKKLNVTFIMTRYKDIILLAKKKPWLF